MRSLLFAVMLLLVSAAPTTQPRTVRVAVIGGMSETGLWDQLSEQFEKQTGIQVQTVATGPKDGITSVYSQGGIDLITMHSSDTIINLVADGWASDPQPWARNDMVIVGPESDPAGVKGMTDAAAALRKIVAARAPFVVHSSLGAQEVLRDILQHADISLDADHTTVLLDDKQRRVLKIAAEKGAYTLVGRIPFHSGKIPNAAMAVMVQGDPRLRRPYVLATADPRRVAGAHVSEARELADFLRSPATQQLLAEFGRGKYDDQPLFFPVTPTRPASALQVSGD
ncbi:MAG: substrate-binding domain-containing protein [Tepidisphaeraceae bacterium]